ncbi:unnamed protein product, partial [Ilex paraguariensis]
MKLENFVQIINLGLKILAAVSEMVAGDILDRAIEAEDRKHGDFLMLEHIEGYLELSTKTKSFFTTTVALWDADFYVNY